MATLPTKIICCYRSGVPLASVTAICTQGWPLLSSFQAALLHPIYNMPLSKLNIKLYEHIKAGHASEWALEDHELQDMRLCMSAIMYSMHAIWEAPQDSKLHVSSLPSNSVAVGSAARLLALSSWYDEINSSSIAFPLYNIDKCNDNMGWDNFKGWLDVAEDIREDWESGHARRERDEEQRRREAALLTVKAEHIYKRIDFNKVWRWIDIQLAESPDYPEGRRTTLKELFMRGDLSPEDWTTDDVDDLVEAILTCCDCGNEITHFIQTRLNHIRTLIVDFYSSFTLLGAAKDVAGNGLDLSEAEKAKQDEFFLDFDRRASNLESLPPAPKREQFASVALFLKAEAQHRILARRFEMRNKT